MLGVSSETRTFISLTDRMPSVPELTGGRWASAAELLAPCPDCCRNKVTRRISGRAGLDSNDASATCWCVICGQTTKLPKPPFPPCKMGTRLLLAAGLHKVPLFR